jgi:hypothetical protein
MSVFPSVMVAGGPKVTQGTYWNTRRWYRGGVLEVSYIRTRDARPVYGYKISIDAPVKRELCIWDW